MTGQPIPEQRSAAWVHDAAVDQLAAQTAAHLAAADAAAGAAEAARHAVARARQDTVRQHPEAPAPPVRPFWLARFAYRVLLLGAVALLAVPLYVTAELLTLISGKPVTRLDRLRAKVDEVLNELDARLGGEDAFAGEVAVAAARVLDVFDRAVDRCASARRP